MRKEHNKHVTESKPLQFEKRNNPNNIGLEASLGTCNI